jgi:hypothetical protein
MQFQLNQRIKISGFGNDPLEGATGTILGPCGDVGGPTTFWIVLLDTPTPTNRAVVIISSCLRSYDDLAIHDKSDYNTIRNLI